jgi:hypothetical protein
MKMNTQMNRKSPWRGQGNFSETVFLNKPIESDPFLGLFEGKAKERRAARLSNADSNTNASSGGGSGTLGNILTGLLGVAGAVVPVLPSLGVGSQSRIAENNAITSGNLAIYNAQTVASLAAEDAKKKNMEMYMLIGGGFFLFLFILMFALKK